MSQMGREKFSPPESQREGVIGPHEVALRGRRTKCDLVRPDVKQILVKYRHKGVGMSTCFVQCTYRIVIIEFIWAN